MVQAKARQTSHHFLLHSDPTVRWSSEEKIVPADILKKDILWVPQGAVSTAVRRKWASPKLGTSHQINADGSNQPRPEKIVYLVLNLPLKCKKMCLFLIITQLLTHGTHTGTTNTGQIPPTYKHTHTQDNLIFRFIQIQQTSQNTHVDL